AVPRRGSPGSMRSCLLLEGQHLHFAAVLRRERLDRGLELLPFLGRPLLGFDFDGDRVGFVRRGLIVAHSVHPPGSPAAKAARLDYAERTSCTPSKTSSARNMAGSVSTSRMK